MVQVVAHRSDAVVTSAPGSAARDVVSRTVARKQSVQNATKMLGTFAARMGSMAQGLVAQPPSAPPPGGIVTATAGTPTHMHAHMHTHMQTNRRWCSSLKERCC